MSSSNSSNTSGPLNYSTTTFSSASRAGKRATDIEQTYEFLMLPIRIAGLGALLLISFQMCVREDEIGQ
jgi:hypothetical protein